MDILSPGRKRKLRDLTPEEMIYIDENYQTFSAKYMSDEKEIPIWLVRKYMKEKGYRRELVTYHPDCTELVMEDKRGYFNVDAPLKLRMTWLV